MSTIRSFELQSPASAPLSHPQGGGTPGSQPRHIGDDSARALAAVRHDVRPLLLPPARGMPPVTSREDNGILRLSTLLDDCEPIVSRAASAAAASLAILQASYVSMEELISSMLDTRIGMFAHDLRAQISNARASFEIGETSLAQRCHQKMRMLIAKMNGRAIPASSFQLQNWLQAIVEETRPAAECRNCSLTLSVEPDEWSGDVYGRAFEMEEILANFIRNAMNYGKDEDGRGKITIVLKRLNETNQQVQIEIVVQDRGQGISQADIQRMLHEDRVQLGANRDAALQRNSSGHGNGICKQMIREIGGEYVIESVHHREAEDGVPSGSKFGFRIWLHKEREVRCVSAPPGPVQAKTFQRTDLRVLFVDDESTARKLATKTYGQMCALSAAENGESGLEQFRQALEQDTPPQIVITDMNMPIEGRSDAIQNGLDMIRRMCDLCKSREIETPVFILLSGDATELPVGAKGVTLLKGTNSRCQVIDAVNDFFPSV